MSADVIPLPIPRRDCAGCGIRFRPVLSWHRLCVKCWRGAAAILAIRRARRLLQGAA